jgi:translation elongation factor EF-4
MAFRSEIEEFLVIKIPMYDIPNVVDFFDKLKSYKRPAGFKHDGLDFSTTDKRVIKNFYDLFIHEKEQQNNVDKIE